MNWKVPVSMKVMIVLSWVLFFIGLFSGNEQAMSVSVISLVVLSVAIQILDAICTTKGKE